MPRDNLEHGWLVGGRFTHTEDHEPQHVGCCDWCGKEIYEDEELRTYGWSKSGEFLCWDCFEMAQGDGLA